MAGILMGALKGTPKASFTVLGFLKKHWYLIILVAVLLPSIIGSIRIAVETKNPSFPLFDLATRILSADNSLDVNTDLLRENPAELVGMEKPENGIWKNVVYGWKFFWNVIYRIMGDVWLIFFPFVVIFKIVHAAGNRSMPTKNFLRASWIFLLYLFITNTIIYIHGVLVGNIFVSLPEGINEYKAYLLLLVNVLPFHGLGNLITFLIQKAAGISVVLPLLYNFASVRRFTNRSP